MWPAFPHEKHEGKCGQIPWHKGGGTQEFPPEDGETAEFFEMKLTDKDDETRILGNRIYRLGQLLLNLYALLRCDFIHYSRFQGWLKCAIFT